MYNGLSIFNVGNGFARTLLADLARDIRQFGRGRKRELREIAVVIKRCGIHALWRLMGYGCGSIGEVRHMRTNYRSHIQ